MLEFAAGAYNTTVLRLLLLISFVLFLEIIFIVLIGYSGIILGHKSNQNKNVMNLINTTDIVNVDAIKYVMYAGTGIYLVYIMFYYILGEKQFEKGVNVE